MHSNLEKRLAQLEQRTHISDSPMVLTEHDFTPEEEAEINAILIEAGVHLLPLQNGHLDLHPLTWDQLTRLTQIYEAEDARTT